MYTFAFNALFLIYIYIFFNTLYLLIHKSFYKMIYFYLPLLDYNVLRIV